MFYLEVCFHAMSRKWTYDSLEDAQIQLDLLAPKIGKSLYDCNEKNKQEATHLIKSKCGDGYVVLSQISSAGIIVEEEWNKSVDLLDKRNMNRARRWKEAGLRE